MKAVDKVPTLRGHSQEGMQAVPQNMDLACVCVGRCGVGKGVGMWLQRKEKITPVPPFSSWSLISCHAFNQTHWKPETKKLGNTFSKGLPIGAHSKTEVENGSEKRKRETLTTVVSDVKESHSSFYWSRPAESWWVKSCLPNAEGQWRIPPLI